MYIKELHIQHFRGLRDLSIKPNGHVVIMGEPGAGRSDLVEALARVLDADASRTRTTTELDFHNRDTTQPIRITITLGDLGTELEQHFLDHLELWDRIEDRILAESQFPDTIDAERFEWVLRLEYWARWLRDEERCEEWVHYPKESDPNSDSFTYVRRRDIEELGFGLIRWNGGKALDLGSRSTFRRAIERAASGDFGTAVAQYVEAVSQAARRFSESAQIKAALAEVVAPLRDLIRTQANDLADLVQFTPDGGSPSGLLRSLGPSVDTCDDAGSLPLLRHGSTFAALFRVAESFAVSSRDTRIVAVDDLGDGLDAASAAHLASVLRKSVGQAWVTTRVPSVAEMFDPQEVVRLGKNEDGVRFARQGMRPRTKAESVTFKHWHRNLLPSLSYRSVIVVEGPDDFAVLHTLSLRLSNAAGRPLPATRRVAIISAGCVGSGGYANVLKLARAAREMGLRAVALVNGDTRQEAKQYLETHSSLPDAVIRLPDDIAIEAAIVHDICETVLREAVKDVATAAELPDLQSLDVLSGSRLMDYVISLIKRNSLHAQLVDALPEDHLPPLAIRLLERAIEVACGTESGVIQL